MLRKKYLSKFIALVLLITVVMNMSGTAFAATTSANLTENKNFTTNSNMKVTEDDKFIVLEDDTSITIIDKSQLNPLIYKSSGSLPRSASYYVTNKVFMGSVVMEHVLGTVSCEPGITADLGITTTFSAGCTTTFGVTSSKVSATVGFDVTKEYSISYNSSYTCPNTYAGRRVKRVELTAQPLDNKYSYDIMLRGKVGIPDVIWETGYAYKPIGVHYSKTFIYY